MSKPVVRVNELSYPFTARVESYFQGSSGREVGSGTLISPNVVLTAAHVVHGGSLGYAWRVEVFLAGESTRARRVEATFQWESSANYRYAASPFDLAVVVLSNPIDRRIAPLLYDTMDATVLRGKLLGVLGFPAEERARSLGMYPHLWGQSSQPASVNESHITYPIDTWGGMSGGPVYGKAATGGNATIYGVHVAEDESSGTGIAIRVTKKVKDLIGEWIAAYNPST